MGSIDYIGKPIRSYTRMDGRRLTATDRVDFRTPLPERAIHPGTRHLLHPGLIVGAVVRYHWPEESIQLEGKQLHRYSTRVHLQATPNGEHITAEVPTSPYFYPTAVYETELPVFDLKIWVNAFKKRSIGSAAIGLLRENTPSTIVNANHSAVQEVLGITPKGDHMTPYFGRVQVGGLYYVPPPAPLAGVEAVY